MLHVSTRGEAPALSFSDALLTGLARDGGLYVPECWPQLSPETIAYARNLLPEGAAFTAIGLGRNAFPAVAASYLAGGHVRVGLEDAPYLAKNVLAPSNAAMVAKARRIVEDLGGQIMSAKAARALLALPDTNVAPGAPHAMTQAPS